MRIALDYRILVVGPSSIHRGMGRFTQQQLREVLLLDGENEYVLVCYADSDVSLIHPDIASAANVSVQRLPDGMRMTGPDIERATALRRSAAFQDWLYRLDLDLFHSTTPFLLEGPVLTDFDVCPMVATFYDVIPLVFPAQYLESWPGCDYYIRSLTLLNRAARLQSISQCSSRDAALYLGFPADRIDLVYPIADPCFTVMAPEAVERVLAPLRARLGLGTQYVLAVSDTHHAKNLESLLQAFGLLPAALRAELPLVVSCHLSPASVNYVRAVADRHGVGDELILTGVVADEELASLYNAATMVVHPSKYEGFGLPILEAMSCGAPVVTTTSSSMPEVAGGAAVLVDSEEVLSFTDAIRELYEDPSRRAKMRELGLERANCFTGSKLARATLDSYTATVPAPASTSPEVQSRRLRLALWTPLPPQRSGIADYSAELLHELAQTHDIEVFVDDGYLPENQLLREHRVQHHSAFDRRRRQAPFDLVVYQMGGSLYHLYMYAPLQAVPGIVVLHDLMWSHVLYAAFKDQDDLAGFRREVAELEGKDALDVLLAIEARAAADPVGAHDDLWGFLSDHPMLGRVLEHSLAQVVHFDSARLELEQRFGATNARTIPMGVRDPLGDRSALVAAEARFRLGIGSTTFVVGVFGIVHAVKRLESCIQAFARLVAVHPDSVLLVVGEPLDDGYTQHLVSLAADLGVLPKVRFAGYLARPEFDAQLASCDAVLNLRAPMTKHMSATLVRALAAGRPLVISELEEWNFLPPDACLLVPAGDGEVDVLSAHLHSLAADRGLRARMSLAARSYFEQEASVRRMAAGYGDLMAEVAGS